MTIQTIDTTSYLGPALIQAGGVLWVSDPDNVVAEYSSSSDGPWSPVPFIENYALSETSMYVRALAVANTVDVEIDNSPSAAGKMAASLPHWNFDFAGFTSADTQGSGTQILATQLQEFADDAAAATGGIPIKGPYRTGSFIKVRVA